MSAAAVDSSNIFHKAGGTTGKHTPLFSNFRSLK